MTLHFVAKESHAAELEERLRQLGFRDAKVLPDGRRVVVSAAPDEIAARLGVSLDSTVREQRVGPARRRVRQPVVPESVRLPAAVEQLVERWYVGQPPDYLAESR
jgi:FixJ family two-component response regulator